MADDFKEADKFSGPGVKENVDDIISLAGFAWEEIKRKLQDMPESAQVATLETVLAQNTRHVYYVQQAKAEKPSTPDDPGVDDADAWNAVLEKGRSAGTGKCSEKMAKKLFAIGKSNKTADLDILEAEKCWKKDSTFEMTPDQANLLLDWFMKKGY